MDNYKYHCENCKNSETKDLWAILEKGEFSYYLCYPCYRVRNKKYEFDKRKELSKQVTTIEIQSTTLICSEKDELSSED